MINPRVKVPIQRDLKKVRRGLKMLGATKKPHTPIMGASNDPWLNGGIRNVENIQMREMGEKGEVAEQGDS